MAAVTIVTDEAALALTAVQRTTEVVEQAIATRGGAFIALSGGRTPRRLYALLADEGEPWRARIDWRRVHVFWGDERHVPPEHDNSNFRLANEALLRHVPIPPDQIHRILGELPDAADAARAYDEDLREAFGRANRQQTFDLVLLGLGEDAHIASLFPGSSVLAERHVHVAAPWVAHLNASRTTLTPPALVNAHRILVLAAGTNKAAAVQAAIEKPINISRWPAQLLRTAGDRVEWIVDRAAAALLHAQT